MALVPVPGAAAPEPEQSDVTPYSVNSPPVVTPPAPPSGDPDEDESPEGRMTFLEHLDELRKRITHAVAALLVGFVIAFAFVERFLGGFPISRSAVRRPGVPDAYNESYGKQN